MELKVWVEGIQRIVCGVTEKTTCQVRKTIQLQNLPHLAKHPNFTSYHIEQIEILMLNQFSENLHPIQKLRF